MTLTRLAVGLEPSNALDAAASFAPIHPGSCRTRSWVPRWIRTRESIKQNKELAEYSGASSRRSRSLACDDYITRIDAAMDASMMRVDGKSPQDFSAD